MRHVVLARERAQRQQRHARAVGWSSIALAPAGDVIEEAAALVPRDEDERVARVRRRRDDGSRCLHPRSTPAPIVVP